jgi:drug/metabolite transporter (DMT)-like permease|tara:strand:- start:92 stop:1033 length:942 start_codon:yes stop_codon:yes gene_type:complete
MYNNIFFIVIAHVLFTTSDMGIKMISGDYALHQIILTRSSVAILFTLLVFVPLEGGIKNLLTKQLTLHILRGFGIGIANLCFFSSLISLPLGEAMAIFFIAPVLISLLSVFILKEKGHLERWLAVLVGLIGVLLILRPSFEAFNPATILPLIAAFSYAMVQIITCKLGEKEKASTMAFFVQLNLIVFSAVFGLFFGDGTLANPSQPIINFIFRVWILPSWIDGLIMCGLGLLNGIGIYFVSQAYRNSRAIVIAPFEFVAIPLAIFWSIIIFGDWPDIVSWLGILLIAGAGLFMIFHENSKNRKNETIIGNQTI